MKLAPVSALLVLLVSSGFLTHFTNRKTGGGDVHYTEIQHGYKTMGDVTFSHAFHTELPNFQCVTCHTGIFTMNRENFPLIKERNERVHSYFDKDQYCGQCHNNSTAFNTDNCNLCHEKAQGI